MIYANPGQWIVKLCIVVRIDWGHCIVIFNGGGLRKYCTQPPPYPPSRTRLDQGFLEAIPVLSGSVLP